jgi:hypothetical protein
MTGFFPILAKSILALRPDARIHATSASGLLFGGT